MEETKAICQQECNVCFAPDCKFSMASQEREQVSEQVSEPISEQLPEQKKEGWTFKVW